MESCSYSKLKSVDIESYDPEMSPDSPIKPIHVMQTKRRRKRSCLGTCLFVSFIVLALLFGLALIAGVCAYTWMSRHVRDWTVTQPVDLPVVRVPSEEFEVFKDQAKLFFDMIQADQAPGSFVVSAKNLNGLVAHSDYLRGNAFAEMETNKVTVSLSLPMDGFPGGKGRFLVGTESVTWNPYTSVIHAMMVGPDGMEKVYYDVQLHLSRMDDGKLNLVLLSGEAFGWEIPEDCIKEHKNILEDLYNCDNDDDDCKHARKLIEGLEEISLQNDNVVFRGRDSDETGSYRALAADAPATSSYKPGWKFQLARRLAQF